MIKAIIFDFDGVIVESVDIKTKAFTELFKKESKAISDKIVQYHLNNTGVSRFDKFKYIYKEMLHRPLSDDEFKGLCDRFAELVASAVVRAPYVRGAEEFLKNNVATYDFFITTGTPQEEVEEIVRRRKISYLFKKIYGAPTGKAEAVVDILKEENIGPGEALYIGDAMSDYNAAMKNLIHFVARIDKNSEPIFKNIDCIKIKDLSGLEKVIGKLQEKDI